MKKEMRDIKELITTIDNISNDILICGHKNADYDSLCSALAFAYGLKQMHKNVKVYVEDVDIKKIEYFDCDDLLYNMEPMSDYTFIMMDLNRTTRLPDKIEDYYKNAQYTINIDHHNGNTTNANYVVSYPEIGSTCEIVYNILREMKIKINTKISELLFTGIISDTNLFSNDSTSETLSIASILLKNGINSDFLINKFYLEKTKEELDIMSYMINNLEYDGFHYVVLDMKKPLFNKISYSDISKRCIPIVLNRQDVETLVVIMNYGNKMKGEIRTKGNVDASKLADLLTGGGHTHAAGFANKKELDEIISICKDYIGGR